MSLRKDKVQLDVEINGKKAGTTYKEIKDQARQLNRELDNLTPGTEDFIRKSAELQKVNTRLAEVRQQTRAVGQAMDEARAKSGLFGGVFQNAFKIGAGITSGMLVVEKIKDFFIGTTTAAADFEKQLSTLSSLTGAAGTDLEFYKQQAIDTGRELKKSASDIVEAYKLVGSARPELLKDKEALTEVAKEAITLSKAAGIDLPTATQSLVGALNQFQLQSSDAARVINALAAGSKEGAAEIPQITEAIDKFGPAANSANVSIEETIGLVETLAEFNIKGAVAGTDLRNVLIKLSAPEALPKEAQKYLHQYGVSFDVLSDKNLNLETRLKELSKIAGDTGAVTKVFGLENVVTGQIILDNVDKFSKYTNAVADTNVAYEQAKINTDNFKGDLEGLGSVINTIKIKVGTVITEGLRPLIKTGTEVLLWLIELPKFIKDNRIAIGALLVALISFNAQAIIAQANILRLALIQKAQTIRTYALAVAQRVLNAAMNANPIGIVVGAIALLISGLALAYKNSEKFRAVLDGLGNVAKEFFRIFMEGFKAFGEGWELIKSGKISDGLKKFGTGLTKLNPVSLAFTEGKRLGDAFNKGYSDSLAKSKADKEAEAFQKKVADAKKTQEPPKTGGDTGGGTGDDTGGGTAGASTKKKPTDKTTKAGQSAIGIVDAILLQNAALKKAYEDRWAEAQKAAITQEQALQTELDEMKAFGMEEETIYKQKEKELQKLRDDAAKKAQEEKLKVIQDGLAAELGEAEKQFLQKMITEEQYNQMLLELKAEAIQKELEIIKAAGKTETAEYKAKELELTRIKAEEVQQRADKEKKYSDLYAKLQEDTRQVLNDTFQLAIDLLGRDEKAKKKNLQAIKAFQIAQVGINLAGEISGIWKNANGNLLNQLIPGWGPIWAGIQTGFAVARAGLQVSKINSAQFAGGGYTGDGGKYEIAGLVHRGEYVFTKDEVQAMGGAMQMELLKSRLFRGYADGGFATGVKTDPVGLKNIPVQSGSNINMTETNKKLDRVIDLLGNIPTTLKAILVISDLEAKQAQYKRTLEEASI